MKGGGVNIVVPFRQQVGIDRQEHLRIFLDRGIDRIVCAVPDCPVTVTVACQPQSSRKFNRGALLNAGAKWAHDAFGAQTIWLHDVDLIPSPHVARLYHGAVEHGTADHLGSCWGRYSGQGFVGGVLGVDWDTFTQCNGFPNNYEGWGGEDDEHYRRMLRCGVRIVRVAKDADHFYEDLEKMTLDEKLSFLRTHREQKNMKKWEGKEAHQSTWETNGVNQFCAPVRPTSTRTSGRVTVTYLDVHI